MCIDRAVYQCKHLVIGVRRGGWMKGDEIGVRGGREMEEFVYVSNGSEIKDKS